jgi:hypothetical protein
MDEWIKQQSLPSNFCSSGSSESVVYGKEDPKVEYGKFQMTDYAVGGPPEMGYDHSGYKEDPEEQWERYQLNV